MNRLPNPEFVRATFDYLHYHTVVESDVLREVIVTEFGGANGPPVT